VLGSAGALDAQGFARALTTELDSFPWRFILTAFRAPSWLPYPGRRRAARAREHIYREAARLVAQRRQVPSARADLLDLLLQARDEETGRVMTDEELVRNLATFILAGHETTAVALTWTLWLLAKYPHVQDQVAGPGYYRQRCRRGGPGRTARVRAASASGSDAIVSASTGHFTSAASSTRACR